MCFPVLRRRGSELVEDSAWKPWPQSYRKSMAWVSPSSSQANDQGWTGPGYHHILGDSEHSEVCPIHPTPSQSNPKGHSGGRWSNWVLSGSKVATTGSAILSLPFFLTGSFQSHQMTHLHCMHYWYGTVHILWLPSCPFPYHAHGLLQGSVKSVQRYISVNTYHARIYRLVLNLHINNLQVYNLQV